MDYLRISIELIGGYIFLLVLTKILGKTQMSQITAFDFISALVLGELVGNALFDQSIGITKIFYAVFIWGSLIYITEVITQKYRRTRPILEGGPSIVIYKGKIVYSALKKNHLDINQLQHLLRQKDIFSIQECAHAILETDGQLSVLKKSEYNVVTKADLKIQTKDPNLPITLILDGEVITENLKTINWSTDQLMTELQKQGYYDPSSILIAEWNENSPLYIQSYENELHE